MAAKRKSKSSKAQQLIIEKYLFNSDNEETYKPTERECTLLRLYSGGKPQAWKSPSQFEIDQLRKRLIAYGCDENTLQNYTITDVVKALESDLRKWAIEDGEIIRAELSHAWKEHYTKIVANPERLAWWQKKEKRILNQLVKANNEHLAIKEKPSAAEARNWLSEVWPFSEYCERLYKLPDDLDAIYLAVGLRLDMLFHARNLITEEMVEVIVGEWQFAVETKISELYVFLCFGPYFNGRIMAYDNPLETFWGYIEADLRKNGFFESEECDSVHEQKQEINLIDFMGKYCDSKRKDIPSKRELLYKYNRAKPPKITLPKLAKEARPGQTKYFFVDDLLTNWAQYRKIMPTLPPLKVQKSTD